MKTSTDVLQHIRKVAISEEIFQKISERIHQKTQKNIKPLWIKIAAVVILGLFVLDIAVILKPKTHSGNSVELIVPQTNNSLYYD